MTDITRRLQRAFGIAIGNSHRPTEEQKSEAEQMLQEVRSWPAEQCRLFAIETFDEIESSMPGDLATQFWAWFQREVTAKLETR